MALCLGPPGWASTRRNIHPHSTNNWVKSMQWPPQWSTEATHHLWQQFAVTITWYDYTHLHSFTEPVLFSAVTPCWARPVKQTGDSGSRFQAGQCPCHHTTRLELLGAAFMETITQQCQCTEGIKSWLQPGKSHPTSDYWGKKTTTSTFTVTLTEWLKVHTLLGDRGRIIKQSSVCFPVSTGRQN